jgi:hypothetical protein
MIVHMRHQLVSAIDPASGTFGSGFPMFPRSSASNGYAMLDIRLQLHSPPRSSHGVTIISGTDKRTLFADFFDTTAPPTLSRYRHHRNTKAHRKFGAFFSELTPLFLWQAYFPSLLLSCPLICVVCNGFAGCDISERGKDVFFGNLASAFLHRAKVELAW